MKRDRIARLTTFLAATIAGGSLFGTCNTRIHDSLVDGARIWVLNLLDPGNYSVSLE